MPSPQLNLIENTAKSPVKRKRIRHLLPELRHQVPDMFDRMDEEQVAEQFGIPVRDVIAEALRDMRRQLLGRSPQAAAIQRRGLMIVRRTA